MLVKELLGESYYMDNLKSFAIDLLVAYRANNLSKINFSKFLASLRQAGFITVDQEYLVDLLDRQEVVKSVDPAQDLIVLVTDESRPDDEEGSDKSPDEENAEKVSKMADDQAKKAVKK